MTVTFNYLSMILTMVLKLIEFEFTFKVEIIFVLITIYYLILTILSKLKSVLFI